MPRYTNTSAGIRCLHLLCHWLNRTGERAFAAISHVGGGVAPTNIDLQTPLLTQAVIDYHFELGLNPIIVYPEVISGNPLEAECVVRWVLNFPGLLGGDADYPDTEMVIAFSKVLALAIGPATPVLHLPVLNEEVFNPGRCRPRSGAAFYAAKYQDFHNGTVFGVPEHAIEITRDRPDSQTPEEIAEILRSVELLYVFENTALATEAVLCGCPAVFMPNPWLDQPIALQEQGWDGFAWGDDPAEIARARATVEQGRENYRRTVDEFFTQLNDFIAQSQAKAAAGRSTRKINAANLTLYVTKSIHDWPDADRKSLSAGDLGYDLQFYDPSRSILTVRQLVRLIKIRPNWRVSEWFRINRTVASVLWDCAIRDRVRRWRKAFQRLHSEGGGRAG